LFPELKGTLVERELRHVIEDLRQVSDEFYYSKDQRWYETKGYPASLAPFSFFGTFQTRRP
jgi:hypothetical protein